MGGLPLMASEFSEAEEVLVGIFAEWIFPFFVTTTIRIRAML